MILTANTINYSTDKERRAENNAQELMGSASLKASKGNYEFAIANLMQAINELQQAQMEQAYQRAIADLKNINGGE